MTDDQRPRGSCVIPDCPRDPYPREDGRQRFVCGPCESRLGHWLREIPVLCGELEAKDAPEEVMVRADVRETLLGWTVWPGWHPPLLLAQVVGVEALTVASALPAAATPGAARGGRVSGSPEPRSPASEDALDLLAAPRSLRRVAGPDDIGFLPVASTLDFWVQDLRDHRGRGEGLPEPSVTVLAGWLLDRLDEACDDYPPIDEMFDHVRLAYGALRGQLGLIDVPQYMKGVPCPGCYRLTLLHKDGSKWIECADCPALLTFDEYEEHVKSMSVEAVAERKRSAADRRALVRLLREMHAVGWRHSTRWQDETDPETGAPEGYRVHQWGRGDELIEVQIVDDEWYSAVSYSPDPDALYGAGIIIGVGWVRANGLKRLHAITSAAGVLSVPKEPAA
jgi:hypothetical protein